MVTATRSASRPPGRVGFPAGTPEAVRLVRGYIRQQQRIQARSVREAELARIQQPRRRFL